MVKKVFMLLALLSIFNTAIADDQMIAEYQVTNLNVNEQVQSILSGINQYTPNKVIITYAGALIYLANTINVSISENSKVPVVLEPLNPLYNYTNGSVLVTLMGEVKQQPDSSNQDNGSFFDYTTPESGFFNY